jgi:CheY-like chemotaxis protein
MKENNSSPIIVIDDDIDDHELFRFVYKKTGCPNELIFFDTALSALEFLTNSTVTPFLVISDINMPMIDGFALREMINLNANLQQRCIPYIFLSTDVSPASAKKAYALSVQGYFAKQSSLEAFEKTLRYIIDYWQQAVLPK